MKHIYSSTIYCTITTCNNKRNKNNDTLVLKLLKAWLALLLKY